MRRIIILDLEPLDSGELVAEAAFRFVAPTSARPRRNSSATSAVPNVTKGELEDIRAGRVIERTVRTGAVAPAAIASIPAALIEMYSEEQARVTAALTGNMMIGREWDGSGWSTGTGDFVAPPEEHKPPPRVENQGEAIVAALSEISQKLDLLIELEGSK